MYQNANNEISNNLSDFWSDVNVQSDVTNGQPKAVDLQSDLDAAHRFLDLLDPKARMFTFQTFDDGKEKRLLAELSG